MAEDLLFDVETPLGFRVRTTREWWQVIVTVKHPAMLGREDDVREALEWPEQVRRSRSDADVFCFIGPSGQGVGSVRWRGGRIISEAF